MIQRSTTSSTIHYFGENPFVLLDSSERGVWMSYWMIMVRNKRDNMVAMWEILHHYDIEVQTLRIKSKLSSQQMAYQLLWLVILHFYVWEFLLDQLWLQSCVKSIKQVGKSNDGEAKRSLKPDAAIYRAEREISKTRTRTRGEKERPPLLSPFPLSRSIKKNQQN